MCSGDHVKYWPYFVTRSPSRTSGHVVAIGHVNGKACASRSSSRLLSMSMDLGMVKNSFMACIALACPLVARLSFDPPLYFQRPCSRMSARLPPVMSLPSVRAFYASTQHGKSYFMKLPPIPFIESYLNIPFIFIRWNSRIQDSHRSAHRSARDSTGILVVL